MGNVQVANKGLYQVTTLLYHQFLSAWKDGLYREQGLFLTDFF